MRTTLSIDDDILAAAKELAAKQVTGTYLLARAHAHTGQLATLDRRLITDTVKAGHQALHLIV